MNSSNTSKTERWTLAELTSRVALALSQADIGQHSGRVRDVPSARTIRYYTTTGLVDRPLAFRGRTALYGRRHLLQLVAIKRLQAQGEALEAVQERLLGLDDAGLATLAGVVAEAKGAEGDDDEVEEFELKAQSRREGAFWEASPAPLTPAITLSPPSRGGGVRARAAPVQGVSLGSGVTLMLAAGVRGLEAQDIEAIEAAAAPLMKVLEARRLLDRGQGEEGR